MKIRDVVLCGVTSCGYSKKNRRFGATYRIHLQGNKILECAQLITRILLTTYGEDSLLQLHSQSRVYPLPWSC
jgi:hypothetical protein